LWIAGIAFIVFYGTAFYHIYPEWLRLSQVAHNGVATSGVVTATEPMNHAAVHYSYLVEGKSYTGIGAAGVGGVPTMDKIQIGDRIGVCYVPENPANSLPGDPNYEFQEWSGLLFLVAPFMCALGSLALGLLLRNRIEKR